jgi:hypothetical protein
MGEFPAVYPEATDLLGFKMETRGFQAEFTLQGEAEIRSATVSTCLPEVAINTPETGTVPSGSVTAAGSKEGSPEELWEWGIGEIQHCEHSCTFFTLVFVAYL